MLNPAFASGDDTALIMGYAGTPDPDQTYVNEVMSLFINPTTPNSPGNRLFPGYNPVVRSRPRVRLPAGHHPGRQRPGPGDHAATRDGTRRCLRLLGEQLDRHPGNDQSRRPACRPTTQSGGSAIRTCRRSQQPQRRVLSSASRSRYRSFPATPADTPYPTDIYTIEYSGSSDFPQYPLGPAGRSQTPSPAMLTCTPFYFPAGQRVSHLRARRSCARADSLRDMTAPPSTS